MMAVTNQRPADLLLTVVVPTRNRVGLLTAQLNALQILLDENIPGQYNVVVGDNSTGDFIAGVRELVESLPDHFTLQSSDRSLDTAEENLARLVPFASGTFTWFLSDDDGLIRAGVRKLVDQIRRNDADIVVFNSLAVKDERIPGGGPARSARARKIFYEPEIDCSLKSFLLQTGFFYYITGFSTTLVRTSLLDAEVFAKYLRIGRIYSHVSFLAEVGANKHFRFVNSPLVTFGMVGTDFDGGNAWHAAGIREGGFELSVWTTLWLRQLDELVKQGVFARNELRFVCEMNHEQRFYWPHMLVQQVITQLLMSGAKVIPRDEADYIVDWLYHLLPDELFALSSIRRGIELSQEGNCSLVDWPPHSDEHLSAATERNKIIGSLRYWAEKITSRDWFQALYIGTVHGHDQYHDGVRWFGFPVWNQNRRAFLETFDLPSVEPYFISTSCEADLTARCRELGMAASSRLQPPTLWMNRSDLETMIQEPSLQNLQSEVVRTIEGSTSRVLHASSAYAEQMARAIQPEGSGGKERSFVRYHEGDVIRLASDLPRDLLVRGLSFSEPWGRWTDGEIATIEIPLSPQSDIKSVKLVIEHVYETLLGKTMSVTINGRKSSIPMPLGGGSIDLAVPAKLWRRPPSSIHIKLRFPVVKLPFDRPVTDTRALGIGIKAIHLLES